MRTSKEYDIPGFGIVNIIKRIILEFRVQFVHPQYCACKHPCYLLDTAFMNFPLFFSVIWTYFSTIFVTARSTSSLSEWYHCVLKNFVFTELAERIEKPCSQACVHSQCCFYIWWFYKSHFDHLTVYVIASLQIRPSL